MAQAQSLFVGLIFSCQSKVERSNSQGLHNVPFNSETGQLELPGMPGLRLPRLRVATLSIMPAIRVQVRSPMIYVYAYG